MIFTSGFYFLILGAMEFRVGVNEVFDKTLFVMQSMKVFLKTVS